MSFSIILNCLVWFGRTIKAGGKRLNLFLGSLRHSNWLIDCLFHSAEMAGFRGHDQKLN